MNRFRQHLTSQCLPRRANYQMSPSIPVSIQPWLTLPGSLTRHLKQHFLQFRVQVLFEGWVRPLQREAKILQLPVHQQVWLRSVLLYGGEQPRVYARTIIPMHTMHVLGYKIRHLANRSLGEFLFCHPHMQRGLFHTLKLSATQQSHIIPTLRVRGGELHCSDDLWGRGSIFNIGAHPLLVSEYFLATMPTIKTRFFSHGE